MEFERIGMESVSMLSCTRYRPYRANRHVSRTAKPSSPNRKISRLKCFPPWKSGAFFAIIPHGSWSMRQESLLVHEPLPVACSSRISSFQFAVPMPKLILTRCLAVNHLDQARAPTIVLLGACVIGYKRNDAPCERAA